MNRESLSRSSRAYNNTHREEQARTTRQKIVDTAVDLLRDGAADGLSVPRLAERSGISVATIYRHFPDRDALFDGVDARIGERLGRPPFPESFEELVAGAPALFAYYERASNLMRLARENPALRELNASRQKGRDRLLALMMTKLTEGVPPRRANAVCALIRTFYGFDAYETMHDRYGVTADEASEVVAWAARTLTGQLEKERAGERGKGGKGGKATPKKAREGG